MCTQALPLLLAKRPFPALEPVTYRSPKEQLTSCARLTPKLTKEKGEEPCKFDFWMATHIESAKTPLDKETDSFVKNLAQAISENPETMESKEFRDDLLAKFLGPEKSGQVYSMDLVLHILKFEIWKVVKRWLMRKFPSSLVPLRTARDELKVEMRGAIEEMVQDLMQSFMKKSSLVRNFLVVLRHELKVGFSSGNF